MRRGHLAILAALMAFPRSLRAEEARPPPSSAHFLQYGVALTAEWAAWVDDVCPDPEHEHRCILGSGGGLTIRVGYRSRGPWYFGGAYELSRHESSNLLRLAILQQLRAELRHYFDSGTRSTPYLSAGLGATIYGNEFTAETGGAVGFLGGGLEFQISQSTVIGAAISYRPLLLRGWTDSTGERRADSYLGFGLAHFVALEAVLEVRDSLDRW